jgi:AcrR family transcriptional regulator
VDLRIVKTRRNIRQAFLTLRAGQPLEKMRVSQLCDLALINKTTFYKHYQDIFALSETIEDETIDAILNSFEDMNLLFTDPDGFVTGLYFAFKAHKDEIMVLFSGRMDNLLAKVERQLLDRYPWISGKPENKILLTFLIWGAAHVLMDPRYDEPVLLDTTTRVANCVIALIDLPAPPPAD